MQLFPFLQHIYDMSPAIIPILATSERTSFPLQPITFQFQFKAPFAPVLWVPGVTWVTCITLVPRVPWVQVHWLQQKP